MEIRLTLQEFEDLLREADLLVGDGETISQVHTEPGELVITLEAETLE